MKFAEWSKEFRAELVRAIRLSAFLTALVFGFLFFQNRTATQEELDTFAAQSPEALRRCQKTEEGRRIPASENTPDQERVSCE